jgi:hypothetical protein
MSRFIALMMLVSCAAAGPTTAPVENLSQLRLRVTTVLDANPPSIRFTASNVGPTAIPEIIFGHRRNWVVVLLPNAEVMQYHIDVDPEVAFGEIASGDSRSWEFAFTEIPMISEKMRGAGEYRLYWEYADVRSNEISFSRSKADLGGQSRPAASRPGIITPAAFVAGFCRAVDGNSGAFQVEQGGLSPALTDEVYSALGSRCAAAVEFRSLLDRHFGKGSDRQFRLESANTALEALPGASLDFGPYFSEVTIRSKPPIKLVRWYEFDWRLAASNFVKAGAVIPEIARGTELIKQASSDLRDGKFATAADAIASIQKTLRERSLRVLDLAQGK